jgi:hypothetical protein
MEQNVKRLGKAASEGPVRKLHLYFSMLSQATQLPLRACNSHSPPQKLGRYFFNSCLRTFHVGYSLFSYKFSNYPTCMK